MPTTVSITVTQQENYRFLVYFGADIQALIADEPSPLGQGAGPAPTQLLMASIANCLSASFFFALGKFKQDAGGLRTTASCVIDRNESNRLRVQQIEVEIRMGKPGDSIAHLDRVLDQFESFCTVTQSVQAGVPVRVGVLDGNGVRLK
ncbi:MAG: OsmC family protein [Burkholderiaceae bacterium]|nr:OsmC family protein [Burkholderiaceae bacterium]